MKAARNDARRALDVVPRDDPVTHGGNVQGVVRPARIGAASARASIPTRLTAVHENEGVAEAYEERPIRLVVRDDDLARNRLTVFFRLLLVIPHLVWLTLWGVAAFVVGFVNWLAVLIEGKVPKILHGFVEGYVRYATHVGAYLFLAAGPYPGFRGAPGYPVDIEIDPPVRQSRWSGLLRLLLAIPAVLLAASLGGSLSTGSGRGAAGAAAFLAWFAILVRGVAPRGLRDLTVFALGYGAQAGGYLLLLTARYPNSDPALAEPFSRLPHHPVRIAVDDDLLRPRLTVLFRLFLAIPHVVWLMLWAIAALLAVTAAWIAALVVGRTPVMLLRFLTAYVRYVTHVYAFLSLVGRRFPGFTGRQGSYEVDLEIDPQGPQSRWSVLLRLFLAVPALILSGALVVVLAVVAFLGWWHALATGRVPEGIRNLGASCLRYSAQASTYLLLCTDRYPYGAPLLAEAEVPSEPESVAIGDAF